MLERRARSGVEVPDCPRWRAVDRAQNRKVPGHESHGCELAQRSSGRWPELQHCFTHQVAAHGRRSGATVNDDEGTGVADPTRQKRAKVRKKGATESPPTSFRHVRRSADLDVARSHRNYTTRQGLRATSRVWSIWPAPCLLSCDPSRICRVVLTAVRKSSRCRLPPTPAAVCWQRWREPLNLRLALDPGQRQFGNKPVKCLRPPRIDLIIVADGHVFFIRQTH